MTVLINLKRWSMLFFCLWLSNSIWAQTLAIDTPDGTEILTISTDKILVQFSEETSFEAQRKVLHTFSNFQPLEPSQILPSPNVAIVSLKTNIDTPQKVSNALKALQQKKEIRYATPFLVHSDGTLLGIQASLMVRLKQESDFNILNQTVRTLNAKVVAQNQFDPLLYHVELVNFDHKNAVEVANEIHQMGFFQYAEPNFLRLMQKASPNDPLLDKQWSIDNNGANTSTWNGTANTDMNVLPAWNEATGEGIKVAVLDEGVDINHPDLAANMLTGYDATEQGSAGNMWGDDEHGTSCAGLIASVGNNNIGLTGIAYNSKIIPVRIAYSNGNNWVTSTVWIANAINWAWETGKADVMSNSWAGGNSSFTINAAIDQALSFGRNGLGTPILFATGNNSSSVQYPASYEKTIAVGAISMCGERASSTSCDGENYWGSNFGKGTDIAAPGVKIYTTDISGSAGDASGDYIGDFNGTSAACPNAAGAMALLLSKDPSLTATEARYFLESTCNKIGTYNYSSNNLQPNGSWSPDLGYGCIDIGAALAAVSVDNPTTTCAIPTDLAVSVNGTEAIFSWNNTADAMSYTVRAKLIHSPNWSEFPNMESPVPFSGFNTCATYEVQVKAVCPTNTSTWTASSQFTTSGGDADGDGICADQDCDDTNPNIGAYQTAGTPCNDGNECTINDSFDANCNCLGTFLDADNDGICDAEDTCNGQLTGTPCNDENPCTINDHFDANCNCLGTFLDADNDGICDAEDTCNGQLTGTPCNDENPCTINDHFDANCNCLGTFLDADNDGICDAEDTCNGQLTGTPCNDENPCTINDSFDANCNCLGTFLDADNDGICDAEDTCNNLLDGTPCNDGNNNTTNDLFDGNCNCIGTPLISCDAPIELSSTSNGTSTRFSWEANELASSFNIRIKKTTQINWLIFNDLQNNTNFSGFTPCVKYEFQIQSNCTEGISSWSESAHFTGLGCQAEEEEDETDCVYTLINHSDFEEGWGIWIDGDGGFDCTLYSLNPNYIVNEQGVRLRDNNIQAHMTTQALDLSQAEELRIDFTYLTYSMDTSAEDFWLQLSTDNGASYQTIEEWNYGDEFVNGVREYESILIPGPFSPNTRLRFRCDASSNGDQVYLDNITISACLQANIDDFNAASPLAMDVYSSPITSLQSSLAIALFPNPVREKLTVQVSDITSPTSLFISNAQGQFVYETKLNTSQQIIDVQALSTGIYFLTVVSDGERVTKRFIVN